MAVRSFTKVGQIQFSRAVDTRDRVRFTHLPSLNSLARRAIELLRCLYERIFRVAPGVDHIEGYALSQTLILLPSAATRPV